jgi:hypothetical protein
MEHWLVRLLKTFPKKKVLQLLTKLAQKMVTQFSLQQVIEHPHRTCWVQFGLKSEHAVS